MFHATLMRCCTTSYGPTETVINASRFKVVGQAPASCPSAVPNTTMHLLDDSLRSCRPV